MSIAQDTQAMQAKLQGNTQALQAMAAQGNMAALLALKELLDQQQYAQSMKANSAMQTPEMTPVLDQMASGLQAAQPARQFADGGTAGELDFEEGEGILGRAGRRAKSGLEWLVDALRLPSQDSFKGGPALPPPVDDTYPERAGMLHPPMGKTSSLSRPAAPAPQAGLAAAVGAGTPKPQDTGPVPPVTIIPLPPPDATDTELAAYQAKMEAFAKEREGLSARQRKMLDDQYARQAKSMTPDKGQRFWDFLANVGAVGGKSAGRALAKGAVQTRDAERQRQAGLQLLEAAHMKEKMLLDQADLAAKEGDANRAYQLRQEAGKVKLEREKAASQLKLQDSQIRENDAQARNQEAQSKGEGYWKPKTTSTAVGGKPMTEAAKASWITKAIDRMAKEEAKDFERVGPASSREQLMAKAKAELAMITGAPASVGAAAPASKRIKFGDL